MPSITCRRPAGEFQMCCQIHPGEGPAVVLVHGFGCAKEDWSAQAEGLAPRFQVVSCDLAGHGESGITAGPCRVEHLGDDVAALLRELGLENTLLVGHSMGCRVVLQAFAHAPDRVGAMAFVDGSWLGEGDPQALEAEFAEAVAGEGFRTVLGRMFEQMFLPGDDPPHRREILARAQGLDEEVGRSLFASMVAFDAGRTRDLLARAGAAGVPVLALQSTYLNQARERAPLSRGQSTPWLDLLRRTVPHARIEVVEGVGHFPMLEAPRRVNAHLERFAAERAAQG